MGFISWGKRFQVTISWWELNEVEDIIKIFLWDSTCMMKQGIFDYLQIIRSIIRP